MKHSCLWLSLVTILLFFSGCKPYQGERPFDYPPAWWISETPNMWFYVDSPYKDPTKVLELEGQLELPERNVKIIVWFNYTDKVTIREPRNDDINVSLLGTCQFHPDKLIVTIKKETDTLLNGKYDTITFIRKPRSNPSRDTHTFLCSHPGMDEK